MLAFSQFLAFSMTLFCVLNVDAIHGERANIRESLTQEEDLITCPENWDLFREEKTCFSRPDVAEVASHDAAQKHCRFQGGYLATATDPEISFFSENYYGSLGSNTNGTSEIHFWMNYVMIHDNRNSSYWNVAQEPVDQQQPAQLPTGLFPASVPNHLSEKSMVCLQLSFTYSLQNNMEPWPWTWKAADCNQKVPYMCEKPAINPCIDRLGNIVAEGEQFSPKSHNDPCVKCRCDQGSPSICSSAACAKPVCEIFRPDKNECCKYDCLDSDGNVYIPTNDDISTSVYLGDNMRWVLTMVTSFLLLGMMLFMVYRMRQKRLAYLRYRVRQLQESQLDFEPGSGPPPPSVDDIDHGFFREPPPPYSYLKADAFPRELPPPYQPSCGSGPRRLNFERASQRSDEVSLLRNSMAGSVPASPASEQTSAPVFLTPPESPNAESTAHSPLVSAATTPMESTATTPGTANTSIVSFLSDPLISPSRNTAV